MPNQLQDVHLGETWTANAAALLGTEPKSFITPPTWTIADSLTLSHVWNSADNLQYRFQAIKMGTTTLTVSASGVTTVVDINVLAPFDRIVVTFVKN